MGLVDIEEIIERLKTAYLEEDWEAVDEVIDYLSKQVYFDENEDILYDNE
jgi:hypothetical protein